MNQGDGVRIVACREHFAKDNDNAVALDHFYEFTVDSADGCLQNRAAMADKSERINRLTKKQRPLQVSLRRAFPYMLDAGIGHGAGDFEGIQLRTVAS